MSSTRQTIGHVYQDILRLRTRDRRSRAKDRIQLTTINIRLLLVIRKGHAVLKSWQRTLSHYPTQQFDSFLQIFSLKKKRACELFKRTMKMTEMPHWSIVYLPIEIPFLSSFEQAFMWVISVLSLWISSSFFHTR